MFNLVSYKDLPCLQRYSIVLSAALHDYDGVKFGEGIPISCLYRVDGNKYSSLKDAMDGIKLDALAVGQQANASKSRVMLAGYCILE